MPRLDAADPLLQVIPIWALGLLLIVICLGAVELGAWLVKVQSSKPSASHKSMSSNTLGLLLGSVFGLLALLIGLTFSLALGRYDERRVLAASEANAIHTTYLRADLFDDPVRSQLKEALRKYAQARIVPPNPTQMQLQNGKLASELVTIEFWMAANVAMQPIRDTARAAYFVTATNEMFDIATFRELAGRAHVPGSILDALFIYLILTSGMLGALLAKDSTRYRVASSMLIVQFILGILLIIDLDRPHAGTILVSQQGLVELVAIMDRDASATKNDK